MVIDEARVAAALPGYELTEYLGDGSYGVVLAARHRRLGAMRAVKVLILSNLDGPEASHRFLTEAQVMTDLDHPHLVRVFEYSEHDTLRLLVMEYLQGGTLEERLTEPIRPETVCAWGLAVADGLYAAHQHGVVHRDIKPANVLFTADGVPKLADFGIAKVLETRAASYTADFVGTPMYVAPEQVLGKSVSPATDLYSLGATLHHAFTGQTPYPLDMTPLALIRQHLEVPAPRLVDVPPRVAEVVHRVLEKNPAARPTSARAFAVDLARAARADFGPGWLRRADVPLRIHHDVLVDETAPPVPNGRTVRPPHRPAPTTAPTGNNRNTVLGQPGRSPWPTRRHPTPRPNGTTAAPIPAAPTPSAPIPPVPRPRAPENAPPVRPRPDPADPTAGRHRAPDTAPERTTALRRLTTSLHASLQRLNFLMRR